MTRTPGMLQFMELQRVRHDLATEKQQQRLCLLTINKRKIKGITTLIAFRY